MRRNRSPNQVKVFLFLYPIKEYISHAERERQDFPTMRINKIIDARYRRNGYAIYWLLFGETEDPQKAETARIHPSILIQEGDRVISCGVSFEKHTGQEVYPKNRDIVSQLPADIAQLVIGGFHQWDCVNRVARYAHRNSIGTRVDEDTTEMFFVRTSLYGPLPLIREQLTLASLGYTKENGFHGFSMRHIKKCRKNKPWFIQT